MSAYISSFAIIYFHANIRRKYAIKSLCNFPISESSESDFWSRFCISFQSVYLPSMLWDSHQKRLGFSLLILSEIMLSYYSTFFEYSATATTTTTTTYFYLFSDGVVVHQWRFTKIVFTWNFVWTVGESWFSWKPVQGRYEKQSSSYAVDFTMEL